VVQAQEHDFLLFKLSKKIFCPLKFPANGLYECANAICLLLNSWILDGRGVAAHKFKSRHRVIGSLMAKETWW
jgi:hypothetical protein